MSRQWQQGGYTQLVHWTPPRVHQAPTHVQPSVHQPIVGALSPVSSWPSEARAEHKYTSTQPGGHGSGYDGNKEESGSYVANSGGVVHHPDHMQRQQQLLEHQRRQQQLQQQYQYHQQPHYPTQYNPGVTKEQELRTQYRLDAPQSDSASPPAGPTMLPTLELKPTPPLTTKNRDSVTSLKTTTSEVTNHKQTETATVSQKEGNEREESGSANSEAGAEPTNQGRGRDSKVTSVNGQLTEEERKRLTLETIQRELDRETHLHPHHPQQRPKPTASKTAPSTASPALTSARQAPFRPASPRRRRRKHRKRISKEAIRAMIM